LNIYATTAANAEESSWGTYCPGEYPSPPPEYETCLGDLYSVAWMEDRYAKHVFRNSCHRRRETKAACKYQVLGVLSTIYLYKYHQTDGDLLGVVDFAHALTSQKLKNVRNRNL
jgi:hypothetical protein